MFESCRDEPSRDGGGCYGGCFVQFITQFLLIKLCEHSTLPRDVTSPSPHICCDDTQFPLLYLKIRFGPQ